MLKRVCILLALVATVALPFALRPKKPALAAAQDTVVIITAHNEATRYEFGRGFQTWYRARTGRTVAVDWRVVGGTSDITRYLEGAYTAAFERHWTAKPGRSWTSEIQAGYVNPKLPTDAPETVRAARAEFLASEVGCGIDLFFGGGSYDYVRQAQAGRIVPTRVFKTHPEWFCDEVIPRTFTGEQYWDDGGCWVGNVLSNFGILYNTGALGRLGLKAPVEWADLADARYVGQVALADPTKSSSIAKAFENIIQQQIQRRMTAVVSGSGGASGVGGPGGSGGRTDSAAEARAIAEGWIAGMQLIQLISGNARYFTDSSQKPVIDVAQGDCAAGVCIDFYGRAQAEAVTHRGAGRLGFVAPRGGTTNAVDPIAVLRGAPHREVAELFLEYTLTVEGQNLWGLAPGSAGGPERYALRRLPVRRDFYERAEGKAQRSDPDAAPFSDPNPLVYHPAWTAHLFRELAFVVRVMALESHAELTAAWRAIGGAPEPARARALAKMSELDAIDYGRVNGAIRQTLNGKDKVDEVRLATELGERFRRQYREAEAIARGGAR